MVQMIVRLDKELKKKAALIARREGKSLSQVVRELLEDYVRQRDIQAHIEDLWEYFGEKIKEQGLTEEDIPRLIAEVRADMRAEREGKHR